MTPVRTLPIRVPPLPGEAIDSWLEAIAHRTDTTFVDLDTALHHEEPVDPAWFHHQYVNQRRTLRELGHEMGRSVSRMSRIAKDYGIPIRPPTDAGNPQSVAIRRLAH